MTVGSNAASPCPTCGGSNLAAARFCCACGVPLDGPPGHSGSPAAGERKISTILFADIQGSLLLIRDRDPEQAQEILDGVVAILCECTHRFGGFVSQNLGDGIMALFGAPVAQEDHADRACHAALAMLEAIARRSRAPPLREPVAVRIGIASGEVVVRAVCYGRVEHYSAVGTVTHLASRLENLATPGSAWLTGDTRRLLRQSFVLRSIGRLPVSGLAASVEVFELGSAPTASSLHTGPALPCDAARFVGRRRELAALHDAAQTVGQGRGRAVLIVADAGVGKSRLVHEFVRTLPGARHRLLCAGGATYGRGTPWLLVAGLLRELFSVAGPGGDARAAVGQGLRALGLDPDEHGTPLLACMDLRESPGEWAVLDHGARRRRVRDALNAVIARLTVDDTLVLVVEDLHDVDGESLGFLEEFASGLTAQSVLMLATARPSFENAEVGLGDRIDLEPLPTPQAEELARELLGRDATVKAVVPELVRRTGGNPFFLQESVRELAESGRLAGRAGDYRFVGEGDLPLPASVQATLAARIDRLPAADRELLRAAATIGEQFDRDLIEAAFGLAGPALNDGLDRLAAGGFLASAGKVPRFCHALIREAAYRGMLQRRRRALHREIVAVLRHDREAAPTGRSERLAQLAHHALAGELWKTAFSAFRSLAEHALARSAPVETLAAAKGGLCALGHLPVSKGVHQAQIDLHFLEADAYFALGDQIAVQVCVDAAYVLAVELHDQRRMVRALSRRSLAHWACGELDAAVEDCRGGRRLADALDDLELRVNTALRLGTFHIAKGEYGRSVEPLEWVIGAIPTELAGERFGLVSVASVAARAALARAFGELLEFELGRQLAREALAMAEHFAHPFTTVFASQEVGLLFIRAGDMEAAARCLRVGHALCRGTPSHVLLPATAAELGYALVCSGETEEGLALLEDAVATAARIGMGSQQAQQIGLLAEVCLRAGDPGRAERLAAQALELSREKGERGDEAWLLKLVGEVAAVTDGPASERRRVSLEQACRLGRELGLRTLLAQCGERERHAIAHGACENSQRVDVAAA